MVTEKRDERQKTKQGMEGKGGEGGGHDISVKLVNISILTSCQPHTATCHKSKGTSTVRNLNAQGHPPQQGNIAMRRLNGRAYTTAMEHE